MAMYSGKEFKENYCRPIVYIWKRGGEWLYVGKCYHGFHRVVHGKLHSVFKPENIEDTDSIEIRYFDTHEECLRVEKTLIDIYQPAYNFKQGRKKDGEPYKDDVLKEILPGYKSDKVIDVERMMKQIVKGIQRRKR